MTFCIIGGTGSLSQALTPMLLEQYPAARIRILSRGEHRQMEMAMKIQSDRLDFLVGDCRDYQRVKRATRGVDVVFHLAAMKSVDKAEYDPWECVLTNIIGTKNVIDACIENGVRSALMTSSDKAVSAVNLYGGTKLVAEKLFIQGNIGNVTKFAINRYGNVAGSQGSILDKFKNSDEIEITDPKMTRFLISKNDAAKFVLGSYHQMTGAEIMIPKMKSTSLLDIAEAMGKPYKVIGERPGEKIDEVLIAKEEWRFITDCGDRWIRWPTHKLYKYEKRGIDIEVKSDFTSANAERLTRKELMELINA